MTVREENLVHYRRGTLLGLSIGEVFILLAFMLLLLFWLWRVVVEERHAHDNALIAELSVFEGLSGERMSGLAAIARTSAPLERAAAPSVAASTAEFLSASEQLQTATIDLLRLGPPSELVAAVANAARDADPEALQALLKMLDGPPDWLEESHRLASFDAWLDGRSLADIDSSLERLAQLESQLHPLTQGEDPRLAAIAEVLAEAADRPTRMADALQDRLGDLLAGLGVGIDAAGAIVLPEGLTFEQGRHAIRPQMARFLREACGPWLAELRALPFEIGDIRIEGHASEEWRAGVGREQAWLNNLGLSQRRASAVLEECLSHVTDNDLGDWVRTRISAVGYSSSRPVLTAEGDADPVGSRRVRLAAQPDQRDVLDAVGREVGQAQ